MTNSEHIPNGQVSDERLALLLEGARHDAANQTSARYKREAEELHLILSELITRRSSAGVVTAELMGAIIPYLAPSVSINEVRRNLVAALEPLPSHAGEDDDNATKWRENVEAMLSSGDPDVIRCHEGGGLKA